MSDMVALIRPATHVGPVSHPAICVLLGRHTGWRAAVIKFQLRSEAIVCRVLLQVGLLGSKFSLAAISESSLDHVFCFRDTTSGDSVNMTQGPAHRMSS